MNNDDALPPLTFDYTGRDKLTELPFFVKHPATEYLPVEKIRENPCYVAFCDPGYNEQMFMQAYTGTCVFAEEGNPLILIETFLAMHRENLYPPLWVMDYIAKVFEEYYNLQGAKTLDEVFKLKVGKGQTPLFKAALKGERDEIMCLRVFKLNSLFKISIEDACFMVSEYFKKEDMQNISEDTLKDKYIRKWKNICENMGIRESILSWDEQQKKVFLQKHFEILDSETIRHLKEKYSL